MRITNKELRSRVRKLLREFEDIELAALQQTVIPTKDGPGTIVTGKQNCKK